MPVWYYCVLGKQFVESVYDVVYGAFVSNFLY